MLEEAARDPELIEYNISSPVFADGFVCKIDGGIVRIVMYSTHDTKNGDKEHRIEQTIVMPIEGYSFSRTRAGQKFAATIRSMGAVLLRVVVCIAASSVITHVFHLERGINDPLRYRVAAIETSLPVG